MKKGFTLVELLAVIVIVALIALVASPIITGVIESSKENTFKDSIYSVTRAAKIALSNESLEEYPGSTLSFNFETGVNLEKLGVNTNKFESGYLNINEDGDIEFVITDGRYCAKKDYTDQEFTIKKYDITTCDTRTEQQS